MPAFRKAVLVAFLFSAVVGTKFRSNSSDSDGVEAGRSLLSRRDSSQRSCSHCLCSYFEDALHCGTKWIKDAGHCGYKTITSASICGESVFKMCYTRRRRRFNLKVTCDTKSVAKSCQVPAECQIGQNCDVPTSMFDCFAEVASGIPQPYRGFLEACASPASLSCSSPSECAQKLNPADQVAVDGNGVPTGLPLGSAIAQSCRELVASAFHAESQLRTLAGGIIGNTAGKLATFSSNIKSQGPSLVSQVTGPVKTIANEAMNLASGVISAWEKFQLLETCTPIAPPSGFWYMLPTDCGAFSKMTLNDFNPLNKESKFLDMKNQFENCAKKTGLLGFPTPFLNLKWKRFCLPDFMVTSMEYFLGAINLGASTTITAAKSLIDGTQAVVNIIKPIADSHLDLMQLAREVHSERHARLGHSSNTTVSCGAENNWGIDLTANYGISVATPKGSVGFSIGMGILMGCKDQQVILPNAILSMSFGNSAAGKPQVETGSDVSIAITFYDSYPEYLSGRYAIGASLNIGVEVDLTNIIGVPVKASVPTGLGIFPNPAVPSTFTFGVSAGGGAGLFLQQLGADLQAVASEASSHAVRAGGDGLHAAIVATSSKLAGSGLGEHLREAAPVLRAEAKTKAVHIDKHKNSIAAEALKTEPSSALMQNKAGGLPVEVGSSVGFKFCITPLTCFGQPQSR
eukprot:TRINITY_DN7854_c0_g3_i1.p1 TRINITY_DN7854_c0_g3~~TRINITY_DN7854_c0_g3_i1.p1  ORF type:complete len:686 (+),score=88.06 TRINITY_DN7854_c0_g3_i1:69-2126(+)